MYSCSNHECQCGLNDTQDSNTLIVECSAVDALNQSTVVHITIPVKDVRVGLLELYCVRVNQTQTIIVTVTRSKSIQPSTQSYQYYCICFIAAHPKSETATSLGATTTGVSSDTAATVTTMPAQESTQTATSTSSTGRPTSMVPYIACMPHPQSKCTHIPCIYQLLYMHTFVTCVSLPFNWATFFYVKID